MIEYVDLKDWRKQQDIILELHRENGINITPREWRNQVEKWNKRFTEGDVEYYIKTVKVSKQQEIIKKQR